MSVLPTLSFFFRALFLRGPSPPVLFRSAPCPAPFPRHRPIPCFSSHLLEPFDLRCSPPPPPPPSSEPSRHPVALSFLRPSLFPCLLSSFPLPPVCSSPKPSGARSPSALDHPACDPSPTLPPRIARSVCFPTPPDLPTRRPRPARLCPTKPLTRRRALPPESPSAPVAAAQIVRSTCAASSVLSTPPAPPSARTSRSPSAAAAPADATVPPHVASPLFRPVASSSTSLPVCSSHARLCLRARWSSPRAIAASTAPRPPHPICASSQPRPPHPVCASSQLSLPPPTPPRDASLPPPAPCRRCASLLPPLFSLPTPPSSFVPAARTACRLALPLHPRRSTRLPSHRIARFRPRLPSARIPAPAAVHFSCKRARYTLGVSSRRQVEWGGRGEKWGGGGCRGWGKGEGGAREGGGKGLRFETIAGRCWKRNGCAREHKHRA